MSPNRHIAKNTLFLYLRMLLNLGVSLYASRVILHVLGVQDFGIYSLVGGVVMLFSFLNTSMSSSTQRFINYEKGKEIKGMSDRIRKVFNISLLNHVLISLVVFFLAETIGLWFLNHKLNIPSERYYIVNWVYQISIVTAIIEILRTPFNALILAFERMRYYAYIGIFESIAKLAIVYLLIVLPNLDHLLLYALLTMLIVLITGVILLLYCRKKFPRQVALKIYRDVQEFKRLLFFSAWMLFGQIVVMGSTHGLGMILNIFHGVVINAAIGIANQVNGAVYGFVSNFQVAFQPQIVQSFAAGKHQRNKELILGASKYSFFLLAMLTAPILFFTRSILVLWLGNQLPPYVDSFVQMIILCSLLEAMAGPFWMAAAATGRIKLYNIILSSINFLTLPTAYILLSSGHAPTSVFVGKFFVAFIMQVFRVYYINRTLRFKWAELFRYLVSISVVCLFLGVLIFYYETDILFDFTQVSIGIALIVSILSTVIYTVGLNRSERSFIVKAMFLKRHHSNNAA